MSLRTHTLRQEQDALLPIELPLRSSLPGDSTRKPTPRPQRSKKLRRDHHDKHTQNGSPFSDHSRSPIESVSTAITHASSESSVVYDSRHRNDFYHNADRNRDYQPTTSREYYNSRDLLRVNRRRSKTNDFHSSDSQLSLGGRALLEVAHTAARKHLHASAPSQLDYLSEEELEAEAEMSTTMKLLHRRESKKAYDPAYDSPRLLSIISEQLELLEKRVQHMTSRQLMELSEKIGVPVAYSHGRGLELVDKEGTDSGLLTKQLRCVLREHSNVQI
jgi:hypothetical protein